MNFSVIIPVRNEEKNIPVAVAALHTAAKLAQANLQIIVVINRCNDNSEQVAKELNLTIVHGSGNLSSIRNAGAQQAISDNLVFVDADSLVSKNMFIKITKTLNQPKYVGGGVLIIPERLSLGILLTGLCLTPIALYYGISGGLFFVRKKEFELINGFDENVNSAEDIDFAKRLKQSAEQRNLRFKNLLTSHIITSCRKFDHFGDWYFLRHPIMCIRLLKNQDQQAANKIWYNFQNRND